jgi:cytochrome P450
MSLPPKPKSREGSVSLWRYGRLFRRDILSAQPEKLYGAWMAEYRTPFFHSFMVNDPDLLRVLLKERPAEFPKSERIAAGLRPLLGNSVFLTNGEDWARQRRIIDPCFEGGRLRESFAAMTEAAEAAVLRLSETAGAETDMEPLASHAAADIIFRTLFSLPIDDAVAQATYRAFQTYQRAQPLLNLAAFLPLPSWMPRGIRPGARRAAAEIRRLIRGLVAARQTEIEAGTAPADLATRIMTTADPETGARFDVDEMVDQVAIFFLAGHETSASAVSWALYLLASHPEWQDRARAEVDATDLSAFTGLSRLRLTRDIFREALRLYPPVPMMVREARGPEVFRNRAVPRGAQIVMSPWHLHRHTRLWEAPDAFDPDRWQTENGARCAREAYMPFSAGPRVCPGAGFALMEGVLLLAHVLRGFHLEPGHKPAPVPVAHLTVRSKSGIWIRLVRR